MATQKQTVYDLMSDISFYDGMVTKAMARAKDLKSEDPVMAAKQRWLEWKWRLKLDEACSTLRTMNVKLGKYHKVCADDWDSGNTIEAEKIVWEKYKAAQEAAE